MTAPATPAQLSRDFMRTAAGLSTVFTLSDLEEQVYLALDNLEEGVELDAQLALIDQMMIEKAEGYVSVIRNLEAMSAARKAEADRLRDRAKTAEKAADWLKARLLTHMQTTGRQRLETTRFTVSVRQNPPHVDVLEEMMVPAVYTHIVTTMSVDKRRILEDFKATGEIPPGVNVSRSESLSIR